MSFCRFGIVESMNHYMLGFSASFRVRDDDSDVAADVALLGPAIWSSLDLPTDSTREPISVTSRVLPRDHGHTNAFPYVVCWAVQDSATDELSIPKAWLRIFPHIFVTSRYKLNYNLPKPLIVSATSLIPLTCVVMAALSEDGYNVAQSAERRLESWLIDDQPVLRQGCTYSFTPRPTVRYQFRLDAVEPVLQGVCVAGITRFIVTRPENVTSVRRRESTSLRDSDSEHDGTSDAVEIDESFLANSVLTTSIATSPPVQNVQLPEHAIESSIFLKNHEIVSTTSGNLIRLRPLGLIASMEDISSTLFVRTSELGRLGTLDNDWVIVQPQPHESSPSRLVKIRADDHLVDAPGYALGTPILLNNVLGTSARRSSPIVRIFPRENGSHTPQIPTASSITIARVASAFSLDKPYQSAILSALKKRLSTKKHLVSKSDLVAVGFDPGNGLHAAENDFDDVMDAASSNERAVWQRSQDIFSERTSFFLISNIEGHDPIDNRNKADTKFEGDLAEKTGELGFWFDPQVTRMVQSGIEHTRIPNISSFSMLNKSSILNSNDPYTVLSGFITAAMMNRAVEYNLQCSVLLKGPRGVGKFNAITDVAMDLGLHILEVNCYELVSDTAVRAEGTLRSRFEKAATSSPCVVVLRHLEALAKATQDSDSGKAPPLTCPLQECMESTHHAWKLSGHPIITVGTTSERDKIPPSIACLFKHGVDFEVPDERQRSMILRGLVGSASVASDVSVSALASQSASFVAGDLVNLTKRAISISRERTQTSQMNMLKDPHWSLTSASLAVTMQDFETALNEVRLSHSESIGAPKIPNVTWDDVGGLAHVKAEILDTIQLPLEHPELFTDGLKKRSGILLYGPPGTGKTLLAKAVATSCSLNFFSVKGPELLNMYIGESEANVRRVFQKARDAKPCVIFFDELDSVAPKRGNHGDSGGVMDRIVSQLLAEMDGMSGEDGADVFVIGATNRPDLLDAALLRPGRFDRMLYLGVSETHEAQLNILEALTRKFRLDPGLDLAAVAQRCPFHYTGADFYALCSDAMLKAMSRKAREIDAKLEAIKVEDFTTANSLTPQYYLAEMATAEDTTVTVTYEDFDHAFLELVPSVTPAEMQHYLAVQTRFSGTTPSSLVQS